MHCFIRCQVVLGTLLACLSPAFGRAQELVAIPELQPDVVVDKATGEELEGKIRSMSKAGFFFVPKGAGRNSKSLKREKYRVHRDGVTNAKQLLEIARRRSEYHEKISSTIEADGPSSVNTLQVDSDVNATLDLLKRIKGQAEAKTEFEKAKSLRDKVSAFSSVNARKRHEMVLGLRDERFGSLKSSVASGAVDEIPRACAKLLTSLDGVKLPGGDRDQMLHDLIRRLKQQVSEFARLSH
ncbi:MAG: hypothetical protein ACC628_18825, partial [Pirellulaceae bacterium]